MSCSQFGSSPSPTSASPTSQAQVLMPGQPVAVGPSSVVPPASSPSTAPAAAAPPPAVTTLQSPTASASGVHACCESGRPVITDPITGQSLCSCQYDAQLLNYQRLTAGLPLNMYGTAAAAAAAAAAYGGEQGFLPLASEQSAFYSPTANGFDLKENLEAWRTLPYAASMYYPYETAALAGYPFANGYGVDLNGARRKNATRETTSTLKAWLNEHRKNPYPTKGEKIMLAIITKMTLTQVSTWFANARRRLKKENKMTWSPRNRCDDDDDADGDDGRSSKDDRDLKSPDSHHKISQHDLHRRPSDCGDDRLKDADLDDIRTDVVDIDEDSKSSEPGSHGLCRNLSLEKGIKSSSPVSDGTVGSDSESSQHSMLSPGNGVSGSGSSSVTDLHASVPKPRIWSIVDTATSGTGSGISGGSVVGGGVSRLSPLQRASRLDYLAPYAKPPPSWYASSLGGQLNPASVAGTFPLYSPMVHSSALASSPGADPAATSLNRLRTAFGGAGDLALGKSASGTPGFGFTGPRLLSSPGQSSGSSAALAAVASMNPMTSVASRVVS